MTVPKSKPKRIERRPITSVLEWLEWRRRDVTASRVAALFAAHPFETVFGLHATVTGAPMPPDKETVAKSRGRALERVVGAEVAEMHPEWRIRDAKVYLRDVDLRLGATPDFFIRTRDGARGVLQAKTVNPASFRANWTDTSAPQWIVLQTLTEMMLARASFGIIAALEIGDYAFKMHLYEVPRHEAAEQRIRDAVVAFWRAVDAGQLPKPDYARDGALIAAMHSIAKPGKEIDLRTDNRIGELLADRERIRAKLNELEAECDAVENEIKGKIGDAEIALVKDWRVTLKQINKKEHTVKATTYRQLRAVRDEAASEPEAAE